mmetsp:Transcript_57737/g.160984  ORF Transcript_57737/g.160984 Transcript_57737/m.160984 type:complete len:284 (+) Transcript_57737:1457-2308(+)
MRPLQLDAADAGRRHQQRFACHGFELAVAEGSRDGQRDWLLADGAQAQGLCPSDLADAFLVTFVGDPCGVPEVDDNTTCFADSVGLRLECRPVVVCKGHRREVALRRAPGQQAPGVAHPSHNAPRACDERNHHSAAIGRGAKLRQELCVELLEDLLERNAEALVGPSGGIRFSGKPLQKLDVKTFGNELRTQAPLMAIVHREECARLLQVVDRHLQGLRSSGEIWDLNMAVLLRRTSSLHDARGRHEVHVVLHRRSGSGLGAIRGFPFSGNGRALSACCFHLS